MTDAIIGFLVLAPFVLLMWLCVGVVVYVGVKELERGHKSKESGDDQPG